MVVHSHSSQTTGQTSQTHGFSTSSSLYPPSGFQPIYIPSPQDDRFNDYSQADRSTTNLTIHISIHSISHLFSNPNFSHIPESVTRGNDWKVEEDMRMSCNGCRVLRKGCGEDCTIRPCLQWIKNPQHQANATLFLAKFYGRAGLINLLNSGPNHLRPAIFRSLLYEACGRIVNPIYGSVGLLWSGSWDLCQAAVEAVLKGAPIASVSSESAAAGPPPSAIEACDIRHVSRDRTPATFELHRVKGRGRFKRPGKTRPDALCAGPASSPSSMSKTDRRRCCADDTARSPSHGSSSAASHVLPEVNAEVESRETVESMFSVETVEASLARGGKPGSGPDEDAELGLQLTLGLHPVVSHADRPKPAIPTGSIPVGDGRTGEDTCTVELGLDLPV